MGSNPTGARLVTRPLYRFVDVFADEVSEGVSQDSELVVLEVFACCVDCSSLREPHPVHVEGMRSGGSPDTQQLSDFSFSMLEAVE